MASDVPIPSFHVKGTVSDRAFMSTTTEEDSAKWFAKNRSDNNYLFKIKLPKGTHAGAGDAREHELILPRGSRIRITDIQEGQVLTGPHHTDKKATIVHGEVI